MVLQDCSVNGCSSDGELIARRAVLREGSTVVFGPRGSLSEFTYRLARTTATRGDEGAGRKRARAEEPAPPADAPQLAEPPQPAQLEPRPDDSQGTASSQPFGPDELNGVMLEEL